jgi:hypothetical protein
MPPAVAVFAMVGYGEEVQAEWEVDVVREIRRKGGESKSERLYVQRSPLQPWFFLVDVDMHTQLGAIRLAMCGLCVRPGIPGNNICTATRILILCLGGEWVNHDTTVICGKVVWRY